MTRANGTARHGRSTQIQQQGNGEPGMLHPGAEQDFDGGMPPPSTIAAQIVNNQSNVTLGREQESRALFAQLLQEYLRDPAAEELNPTLSTKLVKVVAEASLDNLKRESPFDQARLVSEAKDSLLVIRSVLERNPHLVIEGSGEEAKDNPKLCLWLLPKIFAILGTQKCEPLRIRLSSLLSAMIDVLYSVPDLWSGASAMRRLYESCVEDITTNIETFATSSPTGPHSFHVTLPPSRGIAQVRQESLNVVALPREFQVSVASPVQSLVIACELIGAVRGSQGGHTGKHIDPGRANTYLWALDCLSRLWFAYKALRQDLEAHAYFFEDAYLQVMNDLVLQLLGEDLAANLIFKSSILLSEVHSDLLRWSVDSNRAVSVVPVSRSLLRFLIATKHDPESSGSDRNLPTSALRMLSDGLSHAMEGIMNGESVWGFLPKDLKHTIFLWYDAENSSTIWSKRRDEIIQMDFQVPYFENQDLETEFENLIPNLRKAVEQEQERQSKRRKTDEHVGTLPRKEADFEAYLYRIRTAMGIEASRITSDVDDICSALGEDFPVLDDKQKHQVLSPMNLGMLGCAGTSSLRGGTTTGAKGTGLCCGICDRPAVQTSQQQSFIDQSPHRAQCYTILKRVIALCEDPGVQRSATLRISLMLSMKRIYTHIQDGAFLSLSQSEVGQCCLKSLRRPMRELRIAAGRLLPVFLSDAVPETARRQNRIFALNFLKTLSERNELHEQEATIFAFGQVARVCGEDELQIVLLQLVEYLGHTNSLVCSTACNELLSIADTTEQELVDLLRPFWRSVGVVVVKDLITRPQKAQILADLLGMSVNQLLLLTQTDTLPFLVLTKRKDIISRIASARGQDVSVQDVCMQPRRNLAAILALLLRQPSPDVETTAMEFLAEAAPAFRESDLSGLVEIEPIFTACEILKAAADEDEANKPTIYKAFQTLASLAERKGGRSRSSTRSEKILATFFENHILGIIAYFSEVIENSREPRSIGERRRSLAAIEEMIVLAKDNVAIALPQIRACLQASIVDKDLSDQSFSVWVALVKSCNEHDIELFIDQIFTIIAQNWTYFSVDTKAKGFDLMTQLTKSHNNVLKEHIASLPSLASIPEMSKIDSQIAKLKSHLELNTLFEAFAHRCRDENSAIVTQALQELAPFLEVNQGYLQESAASETPSPVLAELSRALLDACVRFSDDAGEISKLCAQCLGLIGCLDPNKVDADVTKREIIVLTNFEKADEVVDFSAFLLENVLVKAFHSASNARAQGFLAYAMQELCRSCGFNTAAAARPRSSQSSLGYQRWIDIPESVRNTLTPFLNSKYMIQSNLQANPELQKYPIFTNNLSHGTWLRTLVFDLLQRAKGDNAQMIFPVLSRIIRGHDLSIATFLLPFAVLNVIVGGSDEETGDIVNEMLGVLEEDINEDDVVQAENLKQSSENVFQVLDYLSRWLQEKRRALGEARAAASRPGRTAAYSDEVKDVSQISKVESVLESIPAHIISNRALECGSYARALFHWEQFIRQKKGHTEYPDDELGHEVLYDTLWRIYAQIDDPDSLEGLSSHMQVLNPDQEVLEHRRAGRWTAAQSWYEIKLSENPIDLQARIDLMDCLKETCQYESLLNSVDSFSSEYKHMPFHLLSFAAEAAWASGKWRRLERMMAEQVPTLDLFSHRDFSIDLARALLHLRDKKSKDFLFAISELRDNVKRGFSASSVASLKSCHGQILKLHVLYEVESLSGINGVDADNRQEMFQMLDRRLAVLGAHDSDKQHLLGVRRAIMQSSLIEFTNAEVAAIWLTSARLARKANFSTTAHNALLEATRLGSDEAKIEHSRLLWRDGHHRKAIQTLEGAIATIKVPERNISITESTSSTTENQGEQHRVKARAQILLAKWLDQAGQTQSLDIARKYQEAVKLFARWDKGHYHLGKYYVKLQESEKALPKNKQSQTLLSGEHSKLIIENFTRALAFGSKYVYQAAPKIITLWLDLGTEVVEQTKRTSGVTTELANVRNQKLDGIHKQLKKYVLERIPPYVFYTALPQIITRISHPNTAVWSVLCQIILRIAWAHPQQSLWSLFAVAKSTSQERNRRGMEVLARLKEPLKRSKNDSVDYKALITHGQRLTDQLLHACNIEARNSHVSLSKDLQFNLKLAPCQLVVPLELTMTATLPTVNDPVQVRKHKAFPRDAVTIASFSDDVLVLSSLQRPRKLTVRGSDGRNYGLMVKPKDDLRKDQRLMEFNAMINRALLRDPGSSKRRLYIKTYGVTPLNEECGAVEWVDNLKPMRDIIIRLYRQHGVKINYSEISVILNEACSSPSKRSLFTTQLLSHFRPVLHEWFVDAFPSPTTWLAARTRFARSTAVMSIVGHILGLGDRHGENVLLDSAGGVFHVDFNCLFDKGLTFEKPELVPFRLTHNMADAMGPAGVDGAFRAAAECALRTIRAPHVADTLLTILETFVYDPTADFLGTSRRRKAVAGVPDTPQEVLESVKGKLGGWIGGDAVPLGVEGYVEALVRMATDEGRLASMYIGWCAFF